MTAAVQPAPAYFRPLRDANDGSNTKTLEALFCTASDRGVLRLRSAAPLFAQDDSGKKKGIVFAMPYDASLMCLFRACARYTRSHEPTGSRT